MKRKKEVRKERKKEWVELKRKKSFFFCSFFVIHGTHAGHRGNWLSVKTEKNDF
jgi:hypothetical protein